MFPPRHREVNLHQNHLLRRIALRLLRRPHRRRPLHLPCRLRLLRRSLQLLSRLRLCRQPRRLSLQKLRELLSLVSRLDMPRGRGEDGGGVTLWGEAAGERRRWEAEETADWV